MIDVDGSFSGGDPRRVDDIQCGEFELPSVRDVLGQGAALVDSRQFEEVGCQVRQSLQAALRQLQLDAGPLTITDLPLGQFQARAQTGQRRAQLVGGVRDHLTFSGRRSSHATDHGVEGGGKPPQFIVRTDREGVVGPEIFGATSHRFDGAQSGAGKKPGANCQDDEQRASAEAEGQVNLVEREVAGRNVASSPETPRPCRGLDGR